MTQGLSVGRLIRASINLSPRAAQRRGFGVLLVAGDSDVISMGEMFRDYTSLEAVGADFGLSAPEYLSAQAYFGQTPRPREMTIGRWPSSDIPAQLNCGVLNAAESLMPSWNAITAGSFSISIDGAPAVDVTTINFATQTNLNGVASQINARLAVANVEAVCEWTGNRFVFKTTATGSEAEIGFLGAAASGVDISAKLKGTASLADPVVPGYDAEEPNAAALRFANASSRWFGLFFGAQATLTDDQHVAVAALIQGLEIERIYGATITSTTVLSESVTNDLASRLDDLNYNRTFTQYSANRYAAASFMGRAFSVDFNANRSTITLMYKQEPGIVAELLTETQANVLKRKNCNVFVEYNNDTAIIQYGVMAGGAYFDEIHGLSWFKDAIQNAEYNLLYQSKTKIPQTDAGQNQLVAVAAAACGEAVNNGLVAPGVWNADGFGQLSRGDFLPAGFYIFTPPLALQNQAIRETRTAPPLQIAIKLAGAFHELDIIVDVNR